MIIDAHFHIFPPLGRASVEEDPLQPLRMKFWQCHMRDSSRFRRKADDEPVPEPFLQWDSDDINEMPEVSFRMADFGRAEITVDGVDYYTQAYPPSLINCEAPPERMIGEMDLVGVDMGVLQHDHIYGALNAYYGEQMRRFPNRFIGLAQVREWEADSPTEHERLEQAVCEHGLKGLYFSVEPFALSNYADHLDDAKFEPLWEKVRDMGIPVWWYLHSRQRDRLGGFMVHVAELDRWAEAHPEIPAVLTHGIDTFSMRRGEERYEIPDALMTVLKRPNMHVEVLFCAFWPEYPFPGAQVKIRELREEIGVHKLLWGTDMPYCSGSWCTYKQAIDYIRVHCAFLSEDEKALILGGNAARMFNLL